MDLSLKSKTHKGNGTELDQLGLRKFTASLLGWSARGAKLASSMYIYIYIIFKQSV